MLLHNSKHDVCEKDHDHQLIANNESGIKGSVPERKKKRKKLNERERNEKK